MKKKILLNIRVFRNKTDILDVFFTLLIFEHAFLRGW